MQQSEAYISGPARHIARLLAEHQHCGAGFEVLRVDNSGSGNLTIVCKGCGARVYRAEEGDTLPGGLIAPERTAEDRIAVERSAGGGRPRGAFLAAGAVLLAALLVAIGAVTLGGDGGSGEEPGAATEVADRDEAGAASGDAPGGSVAEQPPGSSGVPTDAPPAGTGDSSAPAPVLQREFVLDRFSIGVPRGWRLAESGTAVTLDSPDGLAGLQIYYEAGERDPGSLARGAAGYLERLHPGTLVSKPRKLLLGPDSGLMLVADHDKGESTAAVLAVNGYSFFALSEVDSGADGRVRRQARAALESFMAA